MNYSNKLSIHLKTDTDHVIDHVIDLRHLHLENTAFGHSLDLGHLLHNLMQIWP